MLIHQWTKDAKLERFYPKSLKKHNNLFGRKLVFEEHYELISKTIFNDFFKKSALLREDQNLQ
ncbi:hypothetical protein BJD20_09970 [Acinetobacter proteolyticus]|jgi:hypothetical protein|uniref:Uncharacterized protein n=1 Tax=Acinetobacter proteolyticus TaxID=1776741 RepID=A0A653K945_9GAMM|nr:hypothetical protein BJD20_09970 [Acinetobacter proteolyticus]VXA57024.1 conserved hypothetical protein [Acinetobacter proteolyticus]